MKIKCPLCDWENEEGSKFCSKCNIPLIKPEPFDKENPYIKIEEKKQPLELISDEEDKVKNKIEKEREIQTNGNYGISLTEGVIKCPECGTQNPDGAKYCKECGTEVWYYQPIQKLPVSEISVEILYKNTARVMKQFKIPDFIQKILEEVFKNYISCPTNWPFQIHRMYFKDCNLFSVFQEFQVIIETGYYLAIAIEKTTGKIIDIPKEIVDKLEVDYSAKWISDFSHDLSSKGTEIIENLFKKDDPLSGYFNNMFPVSDNIISEILVECAEQNLNSFISTKQLKWDVLQVGEQDMISMIIYNHTTWGLWIRFAERMAEIYRDAHH